jgi:hypothetical protein
MVSIFLGVILGEITIDILKKVVPKLMLMIRNYYKEKSMIKEMDRLKALEKRRLWMMKNVNCRCTMRESK